MRCLPVEIFQRYQLNFTTLLCLKKSIRESAFREDIIIYQSVSAFSFWNLYPTTDRFRSVQWGDCLNNKADNPYTSSQKSDPCNPEDTVLQHADRSLRFCQFHGV